MKNKLSTLYIGTLMTVSSLGLIQESKAASLIGDTVQIQRELTSAGLIFGPFFPIVEVGPSDSVSLSDGRNLFVNVESNSIRFNFRTEFSGGPFSLSDHFVLISDLDFLNAPSAVITDLTFNTNVADFSVSQLTFTDDSVRLNIGGVTYPGGSFIDVDIQASQVPEPLTILGTLMAGSIGVALKKKQQQN